MYKEVRPCAAICSLLFCLGSLATFHAVAQEQASGPIVIPPSKHDTSPPLRDIVAPLPPEASQAPPRAIPLHHPTPIETQTETALSGQIDAVLQSSATAAPASNLLNFFTGISADGATPPDPNGSVGDTQFVEIVNTKYVVYDKTTGAELLTATPIDAIWSGFGGLCASTNGGDPAVLYDKMAHRWLVGQLAYSTNFSSNFQCLAISTTADATGSYYRYAFSFGGNLPDYPKFGVWPDAYYWSSNTFAKGATTFVGAQACAFDRASMLVGSPGNAICFQASTNVASLLPSDLDGSTLPPAGEPNFFLELSGAGSLGLFKFHADFATPSNSTFNGPFTIPVAPFSQACGGGVCIPQPGTTQQLDSLGDRLMYRLAYRNFGDHESLLANHSVTAGSTVGVRWYEIRSPNGAPTVFQQGTYAPDLTFRWMGSMAMDQAGDIALGYSASGTGTYPAVRYAGRVPSDPLGTLESESSIIDGMGAQIGLDRWGDYTSMSVDPVDDCTFWYTNEYLMADGSYNWNTAIGSFRFASCGAASTSPSFSLSTTPDSQSLLQGGSASFGVTVTPSNGFASTVNLSVSGLPSGATASFSQPSVTGSGSSTLTVTTTKMTPVGSYTVTIEGAGGGVVRSMPATLVVSPGAIDFSISVSPSSVSGPAGWSPNFTVGIAGAGGLFGGTVTFSVSGLPGHTSAYFSPASLTGVGYSTLTVVTPRKASAGTYTLTITGTSGSFVHSTKATMTVTK